MHTCAFGEVNQDWRTGHLRQRCHTWDKCLPSASQIQQQQQKRNFYNFLAFASVFAFSVFLRTCGCICILDLSASRLDYVRRHGVENGCILACVCICLCHNLVPRALVTLVQRFSFRWTRVTRALETRLPVSVWTMLRTVCSCQCFFIKTQS